MSPVFTLIPFLKFLSKIELPGLDQFLADRVYESGDPYLIFKPVEASDSHNIQVKASNVVEITCKSDSEEVKIAASEVQVDICLCEQGEARVWQNIQKTQDLSLIGEVLHGTHLHFGTPAVLF